MEKIRWADLTDSDSEESITESTLDLDSFKSKYKHLSLPISLFIKNISFKCLSDSEISQWLSSRVHSSVQVVRNFKKTMFKGDAKVQVHSFDIACKILNLSGIEFLGRPLQIKVLESLVPRHRKQNSWSSFLPKKNSSFCKFSERPQMNKPVKVLRVIQNKTELKKKNEELVKHLAECEAPANDKSKAEMFNQRKSRRTLSYFSFKNLNV
jgi:RNA recognition motif-containing protein